MSIAPRWLYWIYSRTTAFVYCRVPLFGRLRGSVAIVQSGGAYLMVERHDGLGLCFPGGIAQRGESPAETLVREFREETGLTLHDLEELFQFDSDDRLPTTTFVFKAKATGTLRGSWEGTPRWLSLEEIKRRKIFTPHERIVTYLTRCQSGE